MARTVRHGGGRDQWLAAHYPSSAAVRIVAAEHALSNYSIVLNPKEMPYVVLTPTRFWLLRDTTSTVE